MTSLFQRKKIAEVYGLTFTKVYELLKHERCS